jgi:hypothetical protein
MNTRTPGATAMAIIDRGAGIAYPSWRAKARHPRLYRHIEPSDGRHGAAAQPELLK